MENRRDRRRGPAIFQVINLWVIVGALGIACLLFTALAAFLASTRPEPSNAPPSTAVLNVIVAPTFTPQTQTELPGTPTITVPPSLDPGVIEVGAHVQIQGTGGDGLRLRSEAGLNGEILLLGSESEVFRVADGPVDTDGYTWWHLVGPFDETRQGWAVSNYLVVVQNP